MLRVQRKILEEIIDFLILQHVFLLFRQLHEFSQFLTEFRHVHFHKYPILSILRCISLFHMFSIFYMISSMKGNMQTDSAPFQIFQPFSCFYNILKT